MTNQSTHSKKSNFQDAHAFRKPQSAGVASVTDPRFCLILSSLAYADRSMEHRPIRAYLESEVWHGSTNREIN